MENKKIMRTSVAATGAGWEVQTTEANWLPKAKEHSELPNGGSITEPLETQDGKLTVSFFHFEGEGVVTITRMAKDKLRAAIGKQVFELQSLLILNK